MSGMILLLVYLVVTLIVLGFLGWAASQFPMEQTIAKLVRVVIVAIAVLVVCLFLLRVFGIGDFPPLPARR